MIAKQSLVFLFIMFILQGCETQRPQIQTSYPVTDLAAQAERDFPRYKINKRDFYGFKLTEPIDMQKIEAITDHKSKDKDTGGDIYLIKDVDKNFDIIRLSLIEGILFKLNLIKIYNNYSEADNFARILYQKSQETYPREAFEYYENQEKRNYSFTIYFHNDEHKWKKYYISYLESKKYIENSHPLLFHEFLSVFSISLNNIRSSWVVMVEYETKLYHQSEIDMRENRKRKIKGL